MLKIRDSLLYPNRHLQTRIDADPELVLCQKKGIELDQQSCEKCARYVERIRSLSGGCARTENEAIKCLCVKDLSRKCVASKCMAWIKYRFDYSDEVAIDGRIKSVNKSEIMAKGKCLFVEQAIEALKKGAEA